MNKRSIFISAALVILGCVFLFLSRVEKQRKATSNVSAPRHDDRAEDDRAELVKEIERLRAERDALKKELSASISIKNQPEPAPSAQAVEQSGARPHVSADFWAENRARGVEQLISLTPDERREISEKLAAEYRAGTRDRTKALQSVLGESRYQDYEKLRVEAEQKEDQEELESELFTLSRKLKLNPEDEVVVREAIGSVRTTLSELRNQIDEENSDAMALHSAPGDNRPALQDAYRALSEIVNEEQRRRKELLLERLKGKLTDEQLNALVEVQAQENSAFFAPPQSANEKKD